MLIPITRLSATELVLVPSLGDPLSHSLDFDGTASSERRAQVRHLDWTLSWTRDSRNHFLNPSRGSAQSLDPADRAARQRPRILEALLPRAKLLPIWAAWFSRCAATSGTATPYDSYDSDSQATPIVVETPSGGCDPTDVMKLDTASPLTNTSTAAAARPARLRRQHAGTEVNGFLPLGGRRPESARRQWSWPSRRPSPPDPATRIALVRRTRLRLREYRTRSSGPSMRVRSAFRHLGSADRADRDFLRIPFRRPARDRTEDLQFSFGTTF